MFKIKACEKFYHRCPAGSALGAHIDAIGVEVYTLRVRTSEDKILSITKRLGKKAILQEAQKSGYNHLGTTGRLPAAENFRAGFFLSETGSVPFPFLNPVDKVLKIQAGTLNTELSRLLPRK